MKEKEPHIDQLFKEKLDSRSFDFDERQWDKMAAMLNRKSRWGRIKLFTSLAILFSMATYFAVDYFDTVSENKTSDAIVKSKRRDAASSDEQIKNTSEQFNEPIREGIQQREGRETQGVNVAGKNQVIDGDQAKENLPGKIVKKNQLNDAEKTSEKTQDLALSKALPTAIKTSNASSEAGSGHLSENQSNNPSENISAAVSSADVSIPDETVDPKDIQEVNQSGDVSSSDQNDNIPLENIDSENIEQEIPNEVRRTEPTSPILASNIDNPTQNLIAEELAQINEWNTIHLRTLNKPDVHAVLETPAPQTSDPFSTYVSRAYKLSYGIRAGVGISTYSNSSDAGGSSNSTSLYAGLFAAYQIHRRILLEAGVMYAYQGIDLQTRTYSTISYDFYRRELTEQLFVNNLHVIEFPLSVTYKLNPVHLMSMGVQLNYLSMINGEKVASEIYGSEVSPLATQTFTSSEGILETLNWGFTLSYDYQFTPMFRIGMGAHIGLNNWKINSEFNDGHAFNNHQLRMRITYLIKQQ